MCTMLICIAQCAIKEVERNNSYKVTLDEGKLMHMAVGIKVGKGITMQCAIGIVVEAAQSSSRRPRMRVFHGRECSPEGKRQRRSPTDRQAPKAQGGSRRTRSLSRQGEERGVWATHKEQRKEE